MLGCFQYMEIQLQHMHLYCPVQYKTSSLLCLVDKRFYFAYGSLWDGWVLADFPSYKIISARAHTHVHTNTHTFSFSRIILRFKSRVESDTV